MERLLKNEASGRWWLSVALSMAMLGTSTFGLAQSNATQESMAENDAEAYNAKCIFIANEIDRMDRIIRHRDGSGGDILLNEDAATGARLYSHRDGQNYIEYILATDGKKIISRAVLEENYIKAKGFTEEYLRKQLHVNRELPQIFGTGCDRYELQIVKAGQKIASIIITTDVD